MTLPLRAAALSVVMTAFAAPAMAYGIDFFPEGLTFPDPQPVTVQSCADQTSPACSDAKA